MGLRRLCCALVALAASAPAQEPPRQLTAADYDRAARFLPWDKARLILDDDIGATWIGETGLLWYKMTDEGGWRYVIADPARNARRPAFDHVRIAAALAAASGQPVDAAHIPVSNLQWPSGADGPVRLAVGAKLWECAAACRDVSPPTRDPTRAWVFRSRRSASSRPTAATF